MHKMSQQHYGERLLAMMSVLVLFGSDRGYSAALDGEISNITFIYTQILVRLIGWVLPVWIYSFLNCVLNVCPVNLQRERHYYHERKLMYKIMDTLIHLRKMNHDLWAKKDLNDAYRFLFCSILFVIQVILSKVLRLKSTRPTCPLLPLK